VKIDVKGNKLLEISIYPNKCQKLHLNYDKFVKSRKIPFPFNPSHPRGGIGERSHPYEFALYYKV